MNLPTYDERKADVARVMILLAFAFLLLCLTACSVLSPEQKASLLQYAQSELAAGRMTQAQYEALLSALEGGRDWIGSVVEVVTGVGLSLLGVTWLRGPVGNRRGLEPLASRVAEKIAAPSVMVTPVQS